MSLFQLDDTYDACIHDGQCLRRWLTAEKAPHFGRWTAVKRVFRLRPYCRHGVWFKPAVAVADGYWI